MPKRFLMWVSFVLIVLAVALVSAYALLLPGLSQARTEPPAVEIAIATWLLHQSVPGAAKWGRDWLLPAKWVRERASLGNPGQGRPKAHAIS